MKCRKCRNLVKCRNDNGTLYDWCGTALIVDEVKDWGVQAFVHIPMKSDAYIRLTPEQFENLHTESLFMPKEAEE